MYSVHVQSECACFLHVVLYYCEVGKASRGRHGC